MFADMLMIEAPIAQLSDIVYLAERNARREFPSMFPCNVDETVRSELSKLLV